MTPLDNLAHIEWENDIPFALELVKRTIHAMIGEGKFISGLVVENPAQTKWGLNSVDPEMNEAFGSYVMNQVNSKFSITVNGDENKTHIKIIVSARAGSAYGSPAYFQSECDKFTKALAYYLEHPEDVDCWYNEIKPKYEKYQQNSSNSGCMVFLPLIVGTGGYLLYCLC